MDKTEKNFGIPKYVMEFILPILIIIAGAALRLAFLGSVPGGMHQDESFVAWNAYALLHEGIDSAGNVMPVYLADWGDGHSAMYVWLLMPLLALNGGHITPFLSRLPQAVVSIFTLAAVWAMIKRMLGEKAGLWSLFILAVCPWHIMMSRWGLDANLAPGFLIFGLYFFVCGLEKEKYYILSALFYGLSLYCYAVVWPIVPIMLILQAAYALYFKKLKLDRYTVISIVFLFIIALPLMLFVLVNSGFIEEIRLPFMTIPRMNGYRGSELAFTPARMWSNLRTTLSLLWHQNTGSPYDILLPWGLFYDIGRVFIVIGVLWLVADCIRAFVKKEFSYKFFILIPLIGGGVNCLLVTAVLHQINSLYIPLALCEAYGIVRVLELVGRIVGKTAKHIGTGHIAEQTAEQITERCSGRAQTISGVLIAAVYLVCTVLFQRDYYTDYKELVDAYFSAGLKECVLYAEEQCREKQLSTITVEKGAQWPRLLLYTETLPSQYLASVEYDVPPAPGAFVNNEGIRINTRINYDNINQESVYIIYYTDVPDFEADFDITGFYDWYVAVPK